jgi:hypothetical protein
LGWLESALKAVSDLGPRGGLDKFAASLDPAWIKEALESTGTASTRRRKFPAEQAIWLVLGMALYADRSIKAVVDHLGLVLGESRSVASSAVTNARYRLGPEPLRWLFDKVAAAWSGTSGVGGYRGLSLYGGDGCQLCVQDSDENFEHFGKPGGRGGSNDSGYPQLRFVGLMNLSTRLLAGARAGPLALSEHELVRELLALIPDNSLSIFDRGFTSYRTFLSLVMTVTNRPLMIRLKSDIHYTEIEELPDGSILALLMPPEYLLKVDPDLPGPIEVRIISYQNEGGELSRIATTLTDPDAYPADELVELYHKRWELELGFDEIKTHMLERKECLRSKKPEGVYQELWGQLLVYNLVRREMLIVAEGNKLPPNRISFRASLLWIRDFWTSAWMISPGNIPKSLADLRTQLNDLVLPERRGERRYPRHVKIKMSNYARNRGKRPPKRKPPTTSKRATSRKGSISQVNS